MDNGVGRCTRNALDASAWQRLTEIDPINTPQVDCRLSGSRLGASLLSAIARRADGFPVVLLSEVKRALDEADFDPRLEAMCQPYYAATLGGPSIPPDVYFRMISVGYFEGIASHRI
jgi:hypothetical protein